MNNKQVFLSNIVNKFNNQNNSTDSKKIQEKATGYKGMNTRQNSLNIPSEQNPETNSNSSSKNSNATNELASNGLSAAGVPKPISDKIVKSKLGQKAINSLKNKSLALKAFDKLMGGSKTEEEEPQEGTFTNLKVSMKVIRATIYVMPFVMQGIIFCCLFLGASQIFINSMNLGMADSLDDLDDATVEKNINDNKDKWDNEITDDHENLGYNPHADVYVFNAQENSKYIQVAKKYNEADLSELNDFYGSAIYDSAETIENIDMNSVYAFYFKLYYIYSYYKTQYNVKLDLPLLMATLNVNTKDRAVIFGSNIIGYNDEQIGLKSQNDRFAYDKVHNYISTPTKGEYDIEVLAQHMVSKQAIESCVDSNGKEVKSNIIRDEQIGTQVLVCNENETYQVSEAKFAIDEEKYTEFLPEFLEKKYFINKDSSVNGSGESLTFTESYSNGSSTMAPGIALSSEPDPSTAINYWKNIVNPNDFIYPRDEATGLSLGAWPKNYKSIPTQLNNVKVYQGAYIWPTTPTNGIYTYVYEHNGMDIMAKFGTPIYSPVDGILIYSKWGSTSNTGSDETAYSISIEPNIKINYNGTEIDRIFFTHMSGIRYRCESSTCNRKIKQGELVGFVGNAAGSATSVGWAPHLHLTFYNSLSYDSTGLRTSTLEEFYEIKSQTQRSAGE